MSIIRFEYYNIDNIPNLICVYVLVFHINTLTVYNFARKLLTLTRLKISKKMFIIIGVHNILSNQIKPVIDFCNYMHDMLSRIDRKRLLCKKIIIDTNFKKYAYLRNYL